MWTNVKYYLYQIGKNRIHNLIQGKIGKNVADIPHVNKTIYSTIIGTEKTENEDWPPNNASDKLATRQATRQATRKATRSWRREETEATGSAEKCVMRGGTVAEWPLCLRVVLSPILLCYFGGIVYVLPCFAIFFQRLGRFCCRGFLRHVCCGRGLTFTDKARLRVILP